MAALSGRRTFAALAVAFAATTGCARAVDVGTDRTAVAAVEVTNQTAVTLIVSYDAGRGRATLGAVPAGATDRFIVTAPPGTTIHLFGRNEAGTVDVGPVSVTLSAGTTQRATLR